MNNQDNKNLVGDYKYGFKTETSSVLTSGKGLNKEVVKFISKAKIYNAKTAIGF